MQSKSPNQRDNWRRLVNREGKNNYFWERSKDSRVCSFRFLDGEPTTQNPNPTIKLGYDSVNHLLMFSPPVGKRKVTTESSPDYSSDMEKKTSTMARNKEEDPNNLVSLLAGLEKDINQQVDKCPDFDSINKT